MSRRRCRRRMRPTRCAVNSAAIEETPAPTIENSVQGKIPGAVIDAEQRRRARRWHAGTDPRHHVDQCQRESAVRGRWRDGQQRVHHQWHQRADAGDGGVEPNTEDNNAEPHRRHQSGRHREHRDSEGGVRLGDLRVQGLVGRRRHHDQERVGRQSRSGAFSQKVGHFTTANSLNLRQFPTLASAEAWGADFGHSKANIDANYAGPAGFSVPSCSAILQASYETDLSVSGTANQTQYFLSGLSKYDNGPMINTGYNKQTARANVTQQFNSAVSASMNLMYAHSVTRRGVSSNENNGIAPMDVMGYTPQFVNLDHRNADGSWAVNPYGVANMFADAAEIANARGGLSLHWRRQFRLDAVYLRTPEPSSALDWRSRLRHPARRSSTRRLTSRSCGRSRAAFLACPRCRTRTPTSSTTRSTPSTIRRRRRHSTPRRRLASYASGGPTTRWTSSRRT